MAWYSNANGHLGVLAQDVAADGSRSARRATMPGTSDMQIGMIGRTPLAARAGGGFYVAYATGYPTQNRVRVWRVGASNAPVDRQARRQRGAPRARDAAPDGRLWLAWTTPPAATPHVLAARSNEGHALREAVNAGPRRRRRRPTGWTRARRRRRR